MKLARIIAAVAVFSGLSAPAWAALTFTGVGTITFRGGDLNAASLIGQGSHDYFYSGSLDACARGGNSFDGCRTSNLKIEIDGIDVIKKYDLYSTGIDFYPQNDKTFSVGLNSGRYGDNPMGVGFYIRLPGDFSIGSTITTFGDLISGRFSAVKDGQIASYSVDSLSQTTNGSITVSVPEPVTWAMMIGGFGLAGGAMRRQRKINTTVRFA